MEKIHEYMNEFKEQLEKGYIQKSYRFLMEYIMNLKNHFMKKFPENQSSSVYHGYMDMTYFALFPKILKNRKLKIAIVFVYDTFRFEVWLSGVNKKVLLQYWKLFKENKFEKYNIVKKLESSDSIIEHILVTNPNFEDIDYLTKIIESSTMQFIKDVEQYLLIYD